MPVICKPDVEVRTDVDEIDVRGTVTVHQHPWVVRVFAITTTKWNEEEIKHLSVESVKEKAEEYLYKLEKLLIEISRIVAEALAEIEKYGYTRDFLHKMIKEREDEIKEKVGLKKFDYLIKSIEKKEYMTGSLVICK